jgi:hypothetical protein
VCVCVCFVVKVKNHFLFCFLFFTKICLEFPSPFCFVFGCSESQLFSLCLSNPTTPRILHYHKKKEEKIRAQNAQSISQDSTTLLFSLFSLHLLFIYLYITYYNVNMISESTTTPWKKQKQAHWEETTQFFFK